jgi:hypothetical protein
MSIFAQHTLPCPGCGTPMDYELVHSVSADRRPDLREAILDGSFQLQTCPSCGTQSRAEPEFVYMDIARGQYIGVWPASRRHEWQACAAQTRAVFDDALGANAPGQARKLGEKLSVRAVFGWPALVEKLLARQAGIDDRTLEAAKLVVMRTRDETPLPGRMELRLIGEQTGDPVFAWLGSARDDVPPAFQVPRQLISDIDADPAAWQSLRDSVGEGDVVDFQRELLAA